MLWVATMGIHRGCRDKAKNFSSPLGVVLPRRSEFLVLVADEEHLAVVFGRVGFDLGDSIQDGALEIELHHDADSLGQTGIKRHREVSNLSGVDQFAEDRRAGPVPTLTARGNRKHLRNANKRHV